MPDEAQNKPIEDLIMEKTFQGMNDSEIISIIEYAIKVAIKTSEAEAINNRTIELSKILADHYKSIEERSDKQLENLIKSGTQYLQTVDVSENE